MAGAERVHFEASGDMRYGTTTIAVPDSGAGNPSFFVAFVTHFTTAAVGRSDPPLQDAAAAPSAAKNSKQRFVGRPGPYAGATSFAIVRNAPGDDSTDKKHSSTRAHVSSTIAASASPFTTRDFTVGFFEHGPCARTSTSKPTSA